MGALKVEGGWRPLGVQLATTAGVRLARKLRLLRVLHDHHHPFSTAPCTLQLDFDPTPPPRKHSDPSLIQADRGSHQHPTTL